MRGPKHRSDADAVRDRKIGATLAFIRSRDAGQRQEEFARRLGISRGHLASIESGRTPLTASLGWKFCKEFGCNPGWITTAGNSKKSNVFPLIQGVLLVEIEQIIKQSGKLPFRDVWPLIAWRIQEPIEEEKNNLQNDSHSSNPQGEQSEIQKLIARVKLKAAKPGAKAELARALGVAPARITEWLNGDKEPSGNYALRLLQWVEHPEPNQP